MRDDCLARRCARIQAAVFLAMIFGCESASGPLGPTGSAQQFSEPITFDELKDRLTAEGPQRAEIELRSGSSPRRAHEVELEEAEKLADREEVSSVVRALSLSGADCGGQLELGLEGVDVHFDAGAEFEDEAGLEISCEAFVARLESALAAGGAPAVEAKRSPRVENGEFVPQNPGDPRFDATRLELEDDSDTKLEINIDGDNVLACDVLSSPPQDCLGVLHVFDALVVIDAATELKAENQADEDDDEEEDGDEDERAGLFEFEGAVIEADVAARTIRLATGDLIVVPSDEIIDPRGDLLTLQAVQDAVAAGAPVRAEGDAVVASDGVVTAVVTKFEVDD